MDEYKLINGAAYFGEDEMYYNGHVTDTEIIIKPLINAEIVDGIAQREVNELKGNK